MTTASAIATADQLLGELATAPMRTQAPTMGRLGKVRYTHQAMIDLIIQNPEMSQNELAAQFGYTPSWISNVLASDAFQSAMAERREEIVDPVLKASVEERFRALVIQSLDVLMHKLSQPVVADNVALRAAELGAKALGMGGHSATPPPAPEADRLERLANRLIDLQAGVKERVINGQAQRIQDC